MIDRMQINNTENEADETGTAALAGCDGAAPVLLLTFVTITMTDDEDATGVFVPVLEAGTTPVLLAGTPVELLTAAALELATGTPPELLPTVAPPHTTAVMTVAV